MEGSCPNGLWNEPRLDVGDGVHREPGDLGPRRWHDEPCRHRLLDDNGDIYACRIPSPTTVQLLPLEILRQSVPLKSRFQRWNDVPQRAQVHDG